MTKLQQPQTERLEEYTQDLYLDLVLPYEKESVVNGNLITVMVDTEYKVLKLSVLVTLDDAVETVKERFDAQLSEVYDYIESFENWERDNYEHASVTQGYAFDSLTCK